MGSQEFSGDLARKMVVEMLIRSEYRGRGWGSEEKCQIEMKKEEKERKEKWGEVRTGQRDKKRSENE